MMPRKANILIVFYHMAVPMRSTLRDLLYSFGKYSGHRVFYLNLALRSVPAYLLEIPFDLIIFHTLFLNSHWQPGRFNRIRQKVQSLKAIQAVKIALPQDEFFNSKLLCEFINEFNIRYVFSVQPESEWKNIYRDIDFNKVTFHRVLTAYLGKDLLKKIAKRKRLQQVRDVDIGYRTLGMTHKTHAWYGRHGFLKVEIAERVKRRATERGVKCDISHEPGDVINGDNWYWFLMRCKYQLGTEGGTSLMDWDGQLHEATGKYVKNHPDADYDEIERNCFPGMDGTFKGVAISPRHLEACATETCQILIEGHYNGILVPDKHYIELKKDFSNLDQVIDTVIRDDQRERITRQAYKDIVASGTFSYPKFTDFVVTTALKDFTNPRRGSFSTQWVDLIYRYSKTLDFLNWAALFFIYRAGKMLRAIFS
jgi:hypothetical protein